MSEPHTKTYFSHLFKSVANFIYKMKGCGQMHKTNAICIINFSRKLECAREKQLTLCISIIQLARLFYPACVHWWRCRIIPQSSAGKWGIIGLKTGKRCKFNRCCLSKAYYLINSFWFCTCHGKWDQENLGCIVNRIDLLLVSLPSVICILLSECHTCSNHILDE